MWLLNAIVYSQKYSNLIDKVDVGDSYVRYYVYYDKFGNSPPQLGIDRLKNKILPGDEINIRFYPNVLFNLDKDKMIDNVFKKDTSKNGFFVFPSFQHDTLSVQSGYGAIYFAFKGEGGLFKFRMEKDSSKGINMDTTVSISIINKLSNIKQIKLDDFSSVLHENSFPDKWNVWAFENVNYEKGNYILELYQVSPNVAKLLDRIRVEVLDQFVNTSVIYYQDLSKITKIPMEKISENAFYEGIINSMQTVSGIININIIYDYSIDSWYYKEAPSSSKNQKLKFNDDQIPIEKERELPSSIRARVGFASFNNVREARLMSNFVLVLSPKEYFSNSTGCLARLNPTMGFQIGGTGTQDLVFLMGASFKIINEGDFILGVRFGIEPGQPWIFKNNYYFGMSLDPGLFNQLYNNK